MMYFPLLLVWFIGIWTVNCDVKPNILFFLTDDWGLNDVGYYKNSDTQTPFIDHLVATEGLRIDKHYVLPECTVTRCALLTGRYPMRYGMQDGVLYYTSAYALSNYEYLLSNEFQSQGYRTHLVGKWHLGFRSWDYTPTYRGFDTFLGFYMGLMYYYSHYGMDFNYKNSIDLRLGEEEYDEPNVYSLEIYTNRIIQLLKSEGNKQKLFKPEDKQEPFFMYVAWQGSHNPSEAPDEYADMYSRDGASDDTSDDPQAITPQSRQYFQAQTTLTDAMFEKIVVQLKDSGLWQNTLVVFASDNGAAYGYGDNSPLRGAKFTLWEGGVRVPAFITGGYLPKEKRGTVFDQHAMHVTDWYSTLLTGVAGLDVQSQNELDGVNMWDHLIASDIDSDEDSDINMLEKEVKIKEKDTGMKGLLDERYILLNTDSSSCTADGGVCGAIIYGGRWKLVQSSNQLQSTEASGNYETCFWHRVFGREVDNDQFLQCGQVPAKFMSESSCPCQETACLFDLENDPCEYYDISDSFPDVTTQLLDKLTEYSNEQVTPLSGLFNEASYDDVDPTQFYDDGEQSFWTPWDQDTEKWQDMPFELYLAQNYGVEVDVDIDELLAQARGKSDLAKKGKGLLKPKPIVNEEGEEEEENVNIEKNENVNKDSINKMPQNTQFLIFLVSISTIVVLFFGLSYYCLRKIMSDDNTIKTVYDDKTEVSPLMAQNNIIPTDNNTYHSVVNIA